MAELRELWQLLTSERIELVCQYINTHVNPADPISRIKRPEDYQLDGAVFASLDERWGPHTVDRFAAAHNTLLPLWNSELHEPGSAGVNAFAQSDWGGSQQLVPPTSSPAAATRPTPAPHRRGCHGPGPALASATVVRAPGGAGG